MRSLSVILASGCAPNDPLDCPRYFLSVHSVVTVFACAEFSVTFSKLKRHKLPCNDGRQLVQCFVFWSCDTPWPPASVGREGYAKALPVIMQVNALGRYDFAGSAGVKRRPGAVTEWPGHFSHFCLDGGRLLRILPVFAESSTPGRLIRKGCFLALLQ